MIIINRPNKENEYLLRRWKENTIGFVIFAFFIGIGIGYYWAYKAFNQNFIG